MNQSKIGAKRHGGRILADHLARFGVRRIFHVPGESFLAALDGLYDHDIDVVTCRHEGGAAMMAEAHGKLTGEPGIAFVTRGPGACNASAGVHVAFQDGTPMILFVGQIARSYRDREAFQEVDYRAMFGGLAKWVTEIDQIERIPELLAHAWREATTGGGGPVVVALPEDMLSSSAEVADVAKPSPARVGDFGRVADDLCDWITGAERPLVIVGGSGWSAEASAGIARFAETQSLPVAASFRRQDYMDNRHPNYVGDLNVGPSPVLKKRLGEADRLLVLGARLGEIETVGYTALGPDVRIAHVGADPVETGRVFPTEITVTAQARDVVAALAACKSRERGPFWTGDLRAEFRAWQVPQATPGAVRQEALVTYLSETLPEDAILTNGAGNYAAWLHRYFCYKGFGTQLAPTSGSMGYGFPAAIAASLEHPDRLVICFAGDGCFQMTLNEMSTAVQHGAKPIVFVINNGRYGTIRMHQEKHYPARVSGTDLANPDFAALAEAYGGFGVRVTRQDEIAPALAAARAARRVSVIEIVVDTDVLSTGQSLSAARAAALDG